MTDPPLLQDGQFALRHIETPNLERVQREAAAEVVERVTQPFLTQVPPHLSIEDLLIEANQAIEIGSKRCEMCVPPVSAMAGPYAPLDGRGNPRLHGMRCAARRRFQPKASVDSQDVT